MSFYHDCNLDTTKGARWPILIPTPKIGKEILTRQRDDGWGTKVIERLAHDLRLNFPDMRGLSFRNLKYMCYFAESWPDEAIVQAALAQITWYHNLARLEKLKSPEERLWSAEQTVANGWSRNVLVMQIESGLYRRHGKALVSASPAAIRPRQIIKDPYYFDFLTLSTVARERDLERGLSSRSVLTSDSEPRQLWSGP